RAVKRNLLKRRLREAYRLQKGLLDGIDADILLIYSSREVMSSSEIYVRVGELLDRLARNCSKANGEEQA
ncbi:MAG: ribonuclease P protein component, partial [Candidatus Cryptobacteroides sp.]|nr:ribonuclease P protein component [Candidatus Cryptobacteroides sp.]